MRGEKSRSLVGYVLLLLAALGGVLTLSTIRVNQNEPLQDQGYKEVACENQLTYYKTSSLYNVEKRTNSSRAVAFDLVLPDLSKVRVLFDYSTTVSDALVKAKLTNTMDRSIDLSNLKFDFLVSDLEKSEAVGRISLKPGESSFVETTFDLSSVSMDSLKTEFHLTNSACLADIPQFINLKRGSNQSGYIAGISNNDESRSKELIAGINYIGFSDARLVSSLDHQNVGIYSFDGVKKRFVQSNVMEPGQGYLAFNAKSKSSNVVFGNPFWTEQETQNRLVTTGWNLMYNNFGRDVSLDEYTVSFFQDENRAGYYDANPVSISSLIKNNLASKDIFEAHTDGFKQLNSNVITDSSVFWLYVYSPPAKIELKPIDLDFKLEGVGDTYERGQNINFNFVVVNLDSNTHEVVSSGLKDPCSYGIRVSDSSGKIIYNDLGKKVCPLWPAITALQSKAKINYNYTWKVPESASGKYKIEAYFDNFRGVLGDPVLKESFINIK